MRHGLAESIFESDFSRALSATGAVQAKNVARQLIDESDILPTHMLASPFARTQSTAKIVRHELGLTEDFETEELLVHFGDYKMLGDYLLASDFHNLIIVSHMPIVASLCQYLATNSEVYGFKTAQIVQISFSQDAQSNNVGKVSKVYLPKL